MTRSKTPLRRSTRSKRSTKDSANIIPRSQSINDIEDDPILLQHVITVQCIVRSRIARRKIETLRRKNYRSRNYIGQEQDNDNDNDDDGNNNNNDGSRRQHGCQRRCGFSCTFSDEENDHDENTGLSTSNDDTIDKVFRKSFPQWFQDLFFLITWSLFVFFFINLGLLLYVQVYRAAHGYCDVVPLGLTTFDLNDSFWMYHGLVS